MTNTQANTSRAPKARAKTILISSGDFFQKTNPRNRPCWVIYFEFSKNVRALFWDPVTVIEFIFVRYFSGAHIHYEFQLYSTMELEQATAQIRTSLLLKQNLGAFVKTFDQLDVFLTSITWQLRAHPEHQIAEKQLQWPITVWKLNC